MTDAKTATTGGEALTHRKASVSTLEPESSRVQENIGAKSRIHPATYKALEIE